MIPLICEVSECGNALLAPTLHVLNSDMSFINIFKNVFDSHSNYEIVMCRLNTLQGEKGSTILSDLNITLGSVSPLGFKFCSFDVRKISIGEDVIEMIEQE